MKHCLLVPFLLFCLLAEAQEKNNSALLQSKISFRSDSSIFPTSWLAETINAKATQIDSVYISNSMNVLLYAFSKYPPSILEKYLQKVYVTKTLQFYDLSYGGTNSAHNVYLCNRGFTNEWLEMAFHAEFSSLLLRRNPHFFNKQEWMLIADSGVVYGSSGVEALQRGETSIRFNEELNQKGILYPYALSSMENDFNAYAENIFLNRMEFWEIAHQYPKVMRKVQIVISFYNKLSPDFMLMVPDI